jgi:hypothetical protein
MNPGLARLQAYPFERLRAAGGRRGAGGPARHFACRSVSPATSRRRSCSRRCAAICISSTAIRPRAACRNCARRWPRPCNAASCPPARARSGDAWCCRSTARARGCSRSCRPWWIPSRRAGGDAQSLLSDLRGRGAAGRRRALFSEHHRRQLGYVPDLDAVPAAVWRAAGCCILCSPGNPTGAVLPLSYLRSALELAERYDFIIAADECYADLYLDESQPSPSLLRAAAQAGNEALPALHGVSQSVQALEPARVAIRTGRRRGGADRALPALSHLPRLRHAGADATGQHRGLVDDAHVATNRHIYQQKFDHVLPILRPCWRSNGPPARSTCGRRSRAMMRSSRAHCTSARI